MVFPVSTSIVSFNISLPKVRHSVVRTRSLAVRIGGLEPPLQRNQILSLTRLPITPYPPVPSHSKSGAKIHTFFDIRQKISIFLLSHPSQHPVPLAAHHRPILIKSNTFRRPSGTSARLPNAPPRRAATARPTPPAFPAPPATTPKGHSAWPPLPQKGQELSQPDGTPIFLLRNRKKSCIFAAKIKSQKTT